jgi:hypothetical protein
MMAFMDRFFPQFVRLAKAQEFTDLVKGFMLEKQYAAKVVELLHFDPYLVPNEELYTQKFEKWLHVRILDQVVRFELKNVVDLINKALVVERTLKATLISLIRTTDLHHEEVDKKGNITILSKRGAMCKQGRSQHHGVRGQCPGC